MQALQRTYLNTGRLRRIARPLFQGLRALSSVPTIDGSFETIDIQRFQDVAFSPAHPLLMKGQQSLGLPATKKWFQTNDATLNQPPMQTGFTNYLERFSATYFPYELIYPQWNKNSTSESVSLFCQWLSSFKDEGHSLLADMLQDLTRQGVSQHGQSPQLLRFDAPLNLLVKALEYSKEKPAASGAAFSQLYIAQASLNDLPEELKGDVSTPNIVRSAGKGDVYDSSIWLGLEPTYTPWHRDPNPNLFCQICSSKDIRLLPPGSGEHIFRTVQMKLGRHGSSRIRGEEMMQGSERELLHDAIWGEGSDSSILEARVSPGDALFIPKGWWHSVRSVHDDARLNGSVNWWFR